MSMDVSSSAVGPLRVPNSAPTARPPGRAVCGAVAAPAPAPAPRAGPLSVTATRTWWSHMLSSTSCRGGGGER